MLANAVLLAADHSLTDETIISTVLQGKTDDYEILVRRYNQLLYKSAKGILSNEDDIEDIMQEAYIRGFEKLHQFRREARFSTWLTRILINCALQHAHKLKGKEHLRIDTVEDDIGTLEDISSEEPSPLVGESLKKAIEEAINHLPTKYRVVFILREIEYTPVADAATILGISEENVKIRLYRAKGMLKDILKSQLNALEIFEFHADRCGLMVLRVMKHIVSLSASPDTLRPANYNI